jgi:hypothetical protein
MPASRRARRRSCAWIAARSSVAGDLRLGVTPFLAPQALAVPFAALHASVPKVSMWVMTA